jgi:type VI secretion system secreted protein Hcp
MAVDMFLKIGDIKGESVDKVYKDWIDVLAWSWGMSQSGTAHMGPGGGSGKVNVQDMSFTKYVDRSSANIMLKCCNGKHYPEATLVVRKAGGDTPLDYYKVKMTDVLISSISTGGSGGEDRVTENVSLNFAKVQAVYTPQKPDGSKDAAIEMLWHIAENTGSGG